MPADAIADHILGAWFHITLASSAGEKITYTDHHDVPSRYAYYRFSQGVQYLGTPVNSIPESELSAAFSAAGVMPFESKVMRAVSPLEKWKSPSM